MSESELAKQAKWYCIECEKFVDSFIHSQGHMNTAVQWVPLEVALAEIQKVIRAYNELAQEATRNHYKLEDKLEQAKQEIKSREIDAEVDAKIKNAYRKQITEAKKILNGIPSFQKYVWYKCLYNVLNERRRTKKL